MYRSSGSFLARTKKQIVDKLKYNGLIDHLGKNKFFPRIKFALEYAWEQLGDEYDNANCPLRRRGTAD